MTLKPPSWINPRTTNCPKKVSSVPMSMTDNPVTQVALVAVNIAVTGFRNCPFALEIGSHNKREPIAMRARKLHAISECGVIQPQKDIFLPDLFISAQQQDA
jgi:hypothetical protein